MGFLILIRHSMSQPQLDISAHEWTLTEEGRARTVGLARRLLGYGVQAVVSSDEPKAVETAHLLAERLRVNTVNLHDDFRETRRQTAPFYADQGEFNRAIQHAMQNPAALLFGEETFQAAQARFAAAVDRMIAEDPDRSLMIVSHGTILSLYIAYVTGLEAYAIWRLLEMPAYAVFRLPDLKLCELCFSPSSL